LKIYIKLILSDQLKTEVCMAKVMLREQGDRVLFYVAKKDLEEPVVKIEFDSPEKWGGEITLADGQVWYVDPAPKKIPSEVNARKVSGND
jgi:nitrogen fixation protein NifT